jgi:hypothetical protein
MKLPVFAAALCLAVCAGGLTACAATVPSPRAPLWVTDLGAAYPNSVWLCAVETGAGKKAAEDAALASLAQSFSVDVSTASRSSLIFARAAERGGGKNISSSAEFKSFAREVQASSSVEGLIGVEKDFWVSPSGEVWAIARMNRAAAASRYEALITQNERLIGSLMETASQKTGSFDAYANLSFAAEVAVLTDGYAAMLSVLRPQSAGQSLSYGGAKAVKAAQGEEARRIVIEIRVKGDSSGRIASAFSQVFTSRGFRTGAGAYILRAEMILEDAPQTDQNFAYMRLLLAASLSAPAGEIFTWSQNERQGHLTRDGARQRALLKAEELITETGFAPAFDAWLASRL